MVGEAVAFYRRKKGWRREDLAARSKIGFTTICRVEQGKSAPTLFNIKALAEAFEVSIDDLVYFDPATHAEESVPPITRPQSPLRKPIGHAA